MTEKRWREDTDVINQFWVEEFSHVNEGLCKDFPYLRRVANVKYFVDTRYQIPTTMPHTGIPKKE